MQFDLSDWWSQVRAADLESGPLQLLTHLASIADDAGLLRASRTDIAGKLGINERTVTRWFTTVETAGLVSGPSRSGRQVWTRQLLKPSYSGSHPDGTPDGTSGRFLTGHSTVLTGHPDGTSPGLMGHSPGATRARAEQEVNYITTVLMGHPSPTGMDGCPIRTTTEGDDLVSHQEMSHQDLRPVPVTHSEQPAEARRLSPLCRACGRLLSDTLTENGWETHPSCDTADGQPLPRTKKRRLSNVSGPASMVIVDVGELNVERNRKGTAECRRILAEVAARREARERAADVAYRQARAGRRRLRPEDPT